MANLDNNIEKVLVTKEELEAINARLGAQITKDFEGKNLLVVGILKARFTFWQTSQDISICRLNSTSLPFQATAAALVHRVR